MKKITVTINGTEHTAEVEPRLLLVHFIRENLSMTGTHMDVIPQVVAHALFWSMENPSSHVRC